MKKISLVILLSMLFFPIASVQAKSFTPATYAKSLVNHSLSQNDLYLLMTKPADFQWKVAKQVFILDGHSLAEANALVKSWQTEATQSLKQENMVLVGSCDQPVEYKTIVRDAVSPYMTTSFSSSRGTEYLYYFQPWWTVDPNNIRWASLDARVQWAIWFRTSLSGVAGQKLCSKPFTLLLGSGTVTAAGGQYWVMVNLYVHHL